MIKAESWPQKSEEPREQPQMDTDEHRFYRSKQRKQRDASTAENWATRRYRRARSRGNNHRWTQMNTDFTEANKGNRETQAGQKTGQQDFTAETRRPQRNAEMAGKTEDVNPRGRGTSS